MVLMLLEVDGIHFVFIAIVVCVSDAELYRIIVQHEQNS